MAEGVDVGAQVVAPYPHRATDAHRGEVAIGDQALHGPPARAELTGGGVEVNK